MSRCRPALLVAFFVADLVALVFLSYGWAQAPPVIIERAGMDAQGIAVIIAAVFSGIGMLFGMWVTYQNSKIKAKVQDVVTATDGMKDALVKSERIVAKQEGKDEAVAEGKAEAATKALGLAEGNAAAKPPTDAAGSGLR